MSARLSFVLLLACGGCLQITPSDGALHCSSVGNKCPTGYYCASDNTCWHLGKVPITLVHADMSVLVDMGSGGGGGDEMGGGGDDMAEMNMSCMMPSDCPAAPSWCLLVGCIGGSCALVAQPQGTVLPGSLQVPNDCQQLICNATGQIQGIADNSDMPIDPSGGCNVPSCNAGSVTLAPTASGTACTKIANGICNGKGVCGVCKPGLLQCNPGNTKELQTCLPDGSAWMKSMDCQSCPAGTTNCLATCLPANYPQCNGSSLVTCVAGTTTYGPCGNGCCAMTSMCNLSATCTNGVALNGAQCDGTQTQILSCGACGGAGTSHACSTAGGDVGNYCRDNGDGNGPHCVQCQPSQVQCCIPSGGTVANGTQSCSSTGSWGACAACTVPAGATATCSGGVCGCSALHLPACTGTNCGTYSNACGATETCSCTNDSDTCSLHTCKVPTVGTTKPTSTCTTTACE